MYYDLVVLRDTPAAYYRFNELGVGSAADSSGNGQTGTYLQATPVSTMAWNQPGLLANDDQGCVYLGGQGEGDIAGNPSCDHMTTPVLLVPSGDSYSVSIECWIKSTDATWKNGTLWAQATDWSSHGDMFAVEFGDDTGGVRNPGSGWPYGFSINNFVTTENYQWQTNVCDGNVHHVVAVRDGSIPVWKFYLDGSELARNTVIADTGVAAMSNFLYGLIGVELPNDRIGFDGYLERWALYTYALSAAKILEHYNAASPANPGQSVSPSADISAGTWTPDSGTTLYTQIDETVPTDTDYIQATAT